MVLSLDRATFSAGYNHCVKGYPGLGHIHPAPLTSHPCKLPVLPRFNSGECTGETGVPTI